MSLKQSLILLREFVSLRKNFCQYFSIEPALSPQAQKEAFHVRHQVYCKELGWEPENPLEQETDEYDADSIHCLMRSAQSKEYVGCIRLIRPRNDQPFFPLPFEKACGRSLNYKFIDPVERSRFAIAEVSRLAVIGKYRRRKNEEKRSVAITDEDFGAINRPRFPYIPVGLYLGMLEMARRQEIETLYVLTEPSLAGHFNRLGVKLSPIGSSVNHHGERVPLMMRVSKTLSGMSFVVRPLFKEIASQMDAHYRFERLSGGQQTLN
jgi:N-acyl amino acid synthase of PEP-CTERM/exosortase system